jgi:hypothetical protein
MTEEVEIDRDWSVDVVAICCSVIVTVVGIVTCASIVVGLDVSFAGSQMNRFLMPF